jgi:hypothetical protein
LAELSKEKKPFKDLLDRIEHYENLPYLNFTFLDEILLLVVPTIADFTAPFDDPKSDRTKPSGLIFRGFRFL